MLNIKNLSIEFNTTYGKILAVEGLNLSIMKGESFGLVGESGSGKSVTALAVMGLLSQQATIIEGSIFFNGIDLRKASRKQLQHIRGNRIGMIFQEPMSALNPVKKCGKQVIETILLHQKKSKKEAVQKTIALFEKVRLPYPEKIYKAYPNEISGGQKQRVMIAMSIANNPDLLIADEPTTALDVNVQKDILQLLNDLQQDTDMGIFFISHDLAVVATIARRLAVMFKGKLVEEGNVKNIFTCAQHPYTRGLLACHPPLTGRPAKLLTIDDFLSNENGGVFTANISRIKNSSLKSDKPLLTVESLNKSYPIKKGLMGKVLKKIKAVDEVSFTVFHGETLGLVGESGCGKTTLGRSILRLIEPDSGKIFFEDNELTKLSGKEMKKQRKNMSIVFQDPYSSLNPRLSIGKAIMEPMVVHKLHDNNGNRKILTIELLEKVGLKAKHFSRYPHEFSGGQRQRIVIARALAVQPKFIICDEAVSALDVSVQAMVLNLLNSLKREFGFTYIFISHDLSVVRYMSNRIMVMQSGCIIETGDADELFKHPKTQYTRHLIDSIPKIKFEEMEI